MSTHGESQEDGNLAAFICGINDLKVQPYELPESLGLCLNS